MKSFSFGESMIKAMLIKYCYKAMGFFITQVKRLACKRFSTPYFNGRLLFTISKYKSYSGAKCINADFARRR